MPIGTAPRLWTWGYHRFEKLPYGCRDMAILMCQGLGMFLTNKEFGGRSDSRRPRVERKFIPWRPRGCRLFPASLQLVGSQSWRQAGKAFHASFQLRSSLSLRKAGGKLERDPAAILGALKLDQSWKMVCTSKLDLIPSAFPLRTGPKKGSLAKGC